MSTSEQPIVRTPTALERVRHLRGVTWEWIDPARRARDGRPRAIGVIAQEVRAVFPEAVVEGRDGVLRVDYNGLIAPLIEACKELADRVEHLERELVERDASEPRR